MVIKVKNMKAMLYILISALIISIQPILVKYVSHDIGAELTLALRQLGGALFFALVACVYKDEFVLTLRRWHRYLLPGMLIFLAGALYTYSIYLIENATLVGILVKSNAIFIPVLAAMLYADERMVLKSRYFIAGLSLAFMGASGLTLAHPLQNVEFNLGVGLLLLSQLSYSFFSLTLKRLTIEGQHIATLVIIFIFAFLYSTPFLVYGTDELSRINGLIVLIPVFSGFTIFGIAHLTIYKAIELQGVNLTSAFLLITPLLTAVLAFLIFGEMLAAVQVLWGIVLIIGIYLIMRCKCEPVMND